MGMMFQGSKVDLTISVEREKLIGILQDNRQKHEAEYEKSVEGYKKMLVTHAEANLARAKEGRHPNGFPHRRPQNYLPQYDRALGMLKLTEDKDVSLSAYDYARFVEDDWDWKDTFVASSSAFAGE